MQEGGRNNAVRLRTFPLLRMLSATNLRTAGSLSFNNGRCKNTPFVSTSIIPYLFNKWGAVCSLWDDRVNLYDDVYYVRNSLHMPHSSTALPLIFCSSPGTHLLIQLAADAVEHFAVGLHGLNQVLHNLHNSITSKLRMLF